MDQSVSRPPAASGIPTRRTAGWVVSIVVHLAFVGVLLSMRHGAIPEKEEDPEPLVYVEPAPPPPPPMAAANEVPAENDKVVAMEVPQPERELMLVEFTKAPETPKPTKRPKLSPTPSARAAVPPTPNPAMALKAEGVSESSGGDAGGVSGGVRGGVGGGVLGGVVGGHGDEVLHAAMAAEPPLILSRVVPDYPPAARAQRLEGQVLLQAIIDRDGRVEDPVIVVRSVPQFDAAAIAALRQWRFSPGRDGNGRTVRVRIEVPMRFQLR